MKGVFIMKKILSSIAAITLAAGALSCPIKPVYNYSSQYAVTASAEESEIVFGTYENLTYYKYSDEYESYITITDCDKEAEEVVIPSEIDGIPVREIGVDAFSYNPNLRSVVIPDSVIYIGAFAFLECTNLTDITFPKDCPYIGENALFNTAWLENKKAEDPLVIVNNYLIDGTTCKGKVTIPDTVTDISVGAFYDCTEMTSVIIPDSVDFISSNAFTGCTGLTEVTLPDSIDAIYDETFDGCTSLVTINIPESVNYIGGNAFGDTPWLENMRAENPLVTVNNIVIDGKTCAGDVIIPDTVCSISSYAFSGNNDITSITIPESVFDMGYNSLTACGNLQEVTVLNPYAYMEGCGLSNSTELGEGPGVYIFRYYGIIRGYENSTAQEYAVEHAFTFESLGKAPDNPDSDTIYYNGFYCLNYGDHMSVIGYDNSSENVEIPAEIDGIPVTRVEAHAFSGNRDITSLIIPDSVTSVGTSAFYDCRNLVDITFSENLDQIGELAFANTAWLTNKRAENPLVIVNNILIDGMFCTGKVVIPDGVVAINYNAFIGCSRVTEFTIPDSVRYIAPGAFEQCSGITEITIPNGLKEIYAYSFYGCTNLETVNIPKSVTFFGGEAFEGTPWLDNKRAEDPLVIVNNSVIDGRMCTGAVEIPEGVVSLGEWAFLENENITSLTLPASLYDTGIFSLSRCANLEEITILNPNFVIGETCLSNYSEWDEESYEEIRYFNGVIRSYENSGIQYYAQNYGYKFESLGEAPVPELLLGDVNGDGIVDSSDASDVLAEYARSQTGASTIFTEDQFLVADVNNDGMIDSSDASKILAYYADASTGKTPSWD